MLLMESASPHANGSSEQTQIAGGSAEFSRIVDQLGKSGMWEESYSASWGLVDGKLESFPLH